MNSLIAIYVFLWLENKQTNKKLRLYCHKQLPMTSKFTDTVKISIRIYRLTTCIGMCVKIMYFCPMCNLVYHPEQWRSPTVQAVLCGFNNKQEGGKERRRRRRRGAGRRRGTRGKFTPTFPLSGVYVALGKHQSWYYESSDINLAHEKQEQVQSV